MLIAPCSLKHSRKRLKASVPLRLSDLPDFVVSLETRRQTRRQTRPPSPGRRWARMSLLRQDKRELDDAVQRLMAKKEGE